MTKKCKSEGGFTTLIFLSLLLMLTLLGVNAIMTSTSDVDIAGYELNSSYALYAAEAGLEKGAAELREQYDKFGVPPAVLSNDTFQVGNYGVRYVVTKPGATHSKVLTSGAYKGLYSLSDEYEITAVASSANEKAKTTLRMTVDASIVPVYQFAVFYEGDLEIAPGANMTLAGRVHSNKDMYLAADGSTLNIDSYTTAAGNIFHGRSPLSGMGSANGDVNIKDASGNYKNMKNSDGTWLDAHKADWVTSSISRWGGMVEDADHGMTELKLPVVASGQPVDMINPAGSSNVDSYERKAGLKIVNGAAYWKKPDSTWQNVTADLTSAGVITSKTFRDQREGKDVYSTDIDISKLNTSSYWPTNGIVYTSNTSGSNLTATRLVSGSTLKDKLTIASNNPVYTKGDYNTTSKKAAAIMTDAYTVLSNSWNDANSTLAKSSRVASNTTVNVAYMTGNKNSGSGGGSNYSGGYENLPRFLETWSGKTLTWKGSSVCLWQSRQATGFWGGGYYDPPSRSWVFDQDFLDPTKLPPGTPLISIVQKTSWLELKGQAAEQAMADALGTP
jgi:hypothetical protein